jgi:hypothetical protein
MDMEDFDGVSKFVKYDNFSIGDEPSQYRINISGYSGNGGNDTLQIESSLTRDDNVFHSKIQKNS